MPSEISERQLLLKGGVMGDGGAPHPPEPDNLQCPRCESTNTKFCYYNNYNRSQPRYFCKACRRYWTRGGSLRNIPVGGGFRKNSKRSRSHSSPAASTNPPRPSQPLLNVPTVLSAAAPDTMDTTSSQSAVSGVKVESFSPLRCDMNLNEAVPGSFSSLLGSHQAGAFLGLGGYGLGSGSGFDVLGFGLGKAEWPAMVEVGSSRGGGGSSGASSSGCNTWQMEGVDGGGGLVDDGSCFGWPELAISAPGTAGLE